MYKMEKLEPFESNKYVLESPRLVGLSKTYYTKFFIAAFIGLLFIPILAIIFSKALITTFLILIGVGTYYLYLSKKEKRLGKNTEEFTAYRKQTKEINIDDSMVFYKQDTP